MGKYRLYLDVCCLNRPFDDQTQHRIRFEAESIIIILSYIEAGKWTLVSSEIVDFEISRIPDEEKKQKVMILTSMAKEYITVTAKIEKRAMELEKLGFSSYDALHIACAEEAKVDVLLTTDDKLLSKASKVTLETNVSSPVKWLLEVIKNE